MEMDKLQNILTPTQRAKVRRKIFISLFNWLHAFVTNINFSLFINHLQFIVWVTNNQACMHLLNKLWRSVL